MKDRILDQAEMEHGFCPNCGRYDECSCLSDADFHIRVGEVEVKEEEPKALLPTGWLVWMCCNSPGRIYVGTEEAFAFHNSDGYAPCKISWAAAVKLMNGEEKWEFCIPGLLGIMR